MDSNQSIVSLTKLILRKKKMFSLSVKVNESKDNSLFLRSRQKQDPIQVYLSLAVMYVIMQSVLPILLLINALIRAVNSQWV